ncbi:DEBR0S1_21616g1_1 [Brettanomyces bruxellensis]|uniref:DEBR0S1_21616g1_1 n=1 Tax=Dekkera bruxellensis TaxID=5007 RepID=A0A7D9CVH9_DEKBR|nr:DEBR0S1_21616g1_1 [Brettanomyces bruxellensis]
MSIIPTFRISMSGFPIRKTLSAYTLVARSSFFDEQKNYIQNAKKISKKFSSRVKLLNVCLFSRYYRSAYFLQHRQQPDQSSLYLSHDFCIIYITLFFLTCSYYALRRERLLF